MSSAGKRKDAWENDSLEKVRVSGGTMGVGVRETMSVNVYGVK